MTELAKRLDARADIVKLEQAMLAMPDSISGSELADNFNTHYFASGVYARVVYIPAGMCLIGKIHNYAHINIVTKGLIKVITEFGENIIRAPAIFISEPGIKRAGYAFEDTEWITVHANPSNTRDLDEIEAEVIAPDFSRFELGELS